MGGLTRSRLTLSPLLAMWLAAALLMCLLPDAYATAATHPFPEIDQLKSVPTFTHGAVAADNVMCSSIGSDVLEVGGNAVDSAVATALCLGVVHNFASGIGGGGYMMVHMANGTSEFFDFREQAPAAASEDMFDGHEEDSVNGPLAIAIPGEVAGLYAAHSRHGKLPWKDVVTPAAKLASEGFEVGPLLQLRLQQQQKYMTSANFSALGDVFAPNGTLRKAGELFKRESLGRSLYAIAEDGPSTFYGGEVGQKLVEDIQAKGGIITLQDLKSYQVKIREPLITSYHDMTVLTAPPSSGGGASVGLALNILDHCPLREQGPTGESYHQIVESLKFAFGARSGIGDPEFTNTSAAVARTMVSERYAAQCFGKMRNTTRPQDVYMMEECSWIEDKGTSHLSVVDKDRNGVALTTTVNHSFGSKILSHQTGILLNNQMNDFAVSRDKVNAFGLKPSKANRIAPGKRPASSMAPTILLEPVHGSAPLQLKTLSQNASRVGDMRLAAVVGASGGPTIVSSTLQAIIQVFDFDRNPLQAVSLPRLHHQLFPDKVVVEPHFPEDIIEYLKNAGHKVEVMEGLLADGHLLGNVQMIVARKQSVNRPITARRSDTNRRTAKDPQEEQEATARSHSPPNFAIQSHCAKNHTTTHEILAAASDHRKMGQPSGYPRLPNRAD